MKKHKNIFTLVTLSLVMPVVSFAALDGLKTLLRDFKTILDLIVPIVFTLALIYFFWGVAQFILNDAANEKSRADGKQKMLWGILALFVMFSIMGILSIISGTTGIPTSVRVNGNLPSSSFQPSPFPGSASENRP